MVTNFFFLKSKQIMCVSHKNGTCNGTMCLGPAPLGLKEGPKGQISINFNYFVCLLTNERYKPYQEGFLIGRLGHAPGMGLWVTVGGWGHFFSLKFNQSWCVSYLHDCHM